MKSSTAAAPALTRNALLAAGPACRDSFAELAVQLIAVQNAVMVLIELFRALAEHLAAQDLGADPVAEADQAARNLVQALPAEAGSAYGQALAATRTTLHEFSQEARSLKAYASLTRLTAASLNVHVLEAYVVEVHQIADAVRADAQALSECVDVIVRERGPAIAAQRAAEEGLRSMLDDLAAARAASAGLASKDHAFRADLAHQVERLSQGGLAEISSLISMVQFADQFAQRLEHIETILASDADRGAVTVLAAALEKALVDDAEQVCNAALAALDRLGAIARRSALVESEDISESPLGRLLKARRAALDTVQRCNDATASSLKAAAAAAAQISLAIIEAKRQFDTLRASAESIGVAATNALLLPGRTGDARLPLGVLANAVQQSSVAFRDKTAAASRSIRGLSEGFGPEVILALEKGLTGFDASVRLSSSRVEAADESQRRIEAILSRVGPALGTLDIALGSSRTAMDGVLRALRDLRVSAPAHHAAKAEPRPLESFIPMYTMAREREVHAAVTGVKLPEPEPDTGAEVEFF